MTAPAYCHFENSQATELRGALHAELGELLCWEAELRI